MHQLYKTLNNEVHRHRTVKIESLAMYIFLDSEEVCVKLENGLIMSINQEQELLIAYAFRNIPWRTNTASIKWAYYKALKVKSLL